MKSSVGSERRRFRGYSGSRPDIVKLIEMRPQRVLDVGCGAGMTAALIQDCYAGVAVVGVEPNPTLAAAAEPRMTEIVVGQIDDPAMLRTLEARSPFDLIICADVLEHLVQPEDVLINLASLLVEGGRIITSIPNVRHVSTFISLGVLGTWPRRDRGIHDRTHLRWFARKDVLALGRRAGLRLIRERRNLRIVESASWTMFPARLLDFWPFRSFFTFQYLHLWERAEGGNATR